MTDVTLVSTTDNEDQVREALGIDPAATPPPPEPAPEATTPETDPQPLNTEAGPASQPAAAEDPKVAWARAFLESPPPAEDDFEEHGEYVRAVARHEAQRETARREIASATERILAKHHRDIEAFKQQQAPDFDAVFAAAQEPAQQILRDLGPGALAIMDRYTTQDADNGPAMVYHLLKHPEEMRRIAQLSPPMQLAALGRLDATISLNTDRSSATASPSRRTPSKTPKAEPSSRATLVGYSEGAPVHDTEDFKAYKARRNREERGRR